MDKLTIHELFNIFEKGNQINYIKLKVDNNFINYSLLNKRLIHQEATSSSLITRKDLIYQFQAITSIPYIKLKPLPKQKSEVEGNRNNYIERDIKYEKTNKIRNKTNKLLNEIKKNEKSLNQRSIIVNNSDLSNVNLLYKTMKLREKALQEKKEKHYQDISNRISRFNSRFIISPNSSISLFLKSDKSVLK